MNHLSCDGAITVDSSGSPLCVNGWISQTSEQLSTQISVFGNTQGMTLEMYELLSTEMAIILIVAFGWRAAYSVLNSSGVKENE